MPRLLGVATVAKLNHAGCVRVIPLLSVLNPAAPSVTSGLTATTVATSDAHLHSAATFERRTRRLRVSCSAAAFAICRPKPVSPHPAQLRVSRDAPLVLCRRPQTMAKRWRGERRVPCSSRMIEQPGSRPRHGRIGTGRARRAFWQARMIESLLVIRCRHVP